MNSAIRNARAGLWEKALALPTATESDFFGKNRAPSGVDPQLLKIISDTSLRTRLIDSGIAQGLQSPKGPQKIPSIIRLFPNFDAPGKDATSAGSPPLQSSRAAYGLPTVEELDALVARVHQLEDEVSAELQGHVNAEVERLRAQIGASENTDLELAVHDLGLALAKRKALGASIREETFKRIEADSTFGPRKYLRLISREPKE